MRKLFLLFTLMCCSLVCNALKINKDFITNNNNKTIATGVKLENGVLILDNANISEDLNITNVSDDLKRKDVNLTIKIRGKNTINGFIFVNCSDVKIIADSEDAELTVKGGYNAIELSGDLNTSTYARLTLGDGYSPLLLNLYGNSYIICISSNTYLSINNKTTINFGSCSKSFISNSNADGYIRLGTEEAFSYPEGAIIQDGRLFLNNGQKTTDGARIEPIQEYYDLWVKGERVHNFSKSSILDVGKMSYDPSTKTLSMERVYLNGESNSVIKSNIEGLTIDVSGDCDLINSSETNPVIHCTASTTLTSTDNNPTLTIKNKDENGTAILNEGCAFTIDGGKYGFLTKIIKSGSGIRGKGNGAKLFFRNAKVQVESQKKGSIYNQSSIDMDRCALSSTGAYIANGAVMNNGQVMTDYTSINPVETYSIWVAGTQINAINCNDVLGDGKVSYNSKIKTLTVEGDITSSTESVIRNGETGLNIVLRNNCVLKYNGTNASKSVIQCGAPTTITSDVAGTTATLKSTAYGIDASTYSVVIDGKNYLTLLVDATSYGIRGILTDFGSTSLTINNADVRISASAKGAIINIGSLNLEGVKIQNKDASFSERDAAVVDVNYNTYKGELWINKDTPMPEEYSLWVAGTKVSTSNMNDVLGDGKVSYDPDNKILFLNGATVVYNSDSAIKSYISGLTIKMSGNVTVRYSGSSFTYSGIEAQASTTITSDTPGTYATITGSKAGILHNQANLTIDGQSGYNLRLLVIGKQYAIRSDLGATSSNLTVKNAEVRTSSTTYAAICGENTLNLSGVKLQTAGTKFSNGAVVDSDGNYFTKELLICYDRYPVSVRDKQVTEFNYKDILGDGKVSYNPTTKTLTLNNATIIGSSNQVIIRLYDEVTINLVGENTLCSNSAICIENSDYKIIITGGKLIAESSDANVIVAEFGLDIKNTDMSLYSDGGSAINLADEPLNITNSQVVLENNYEDPVLIGCKALNLSSGMGIDPGTRFDTTSKIFVGSDNQEKKGFIGFYNMDVNKDGKFDASDINAMRDILLETAASASYNKIDLNSDHEITIEDLTGLVQSLANSAK